MPRAIPWLHTQPSLGFPMCPFLLLLGHPLSSAPSASPLHSQPARGRKDRRRKATPLLGSFGDAWSLREASSNTTDHTDESERSLGHPVTQEHHKPNDSLTKALAGSIIVHAQSNVSFCQDGSDDSVQTLVPIHKG